MSDFSLEEQVASWERVSAEREKKFQSLLSTLKVIRVWAENPRGPADFADIARMANTAITEATT